VIELIEIPAGTFLMGSSDLDAGTHSDEYPQHKVKVPAFLMGKYPITRYQYGSVMEKDPCYLKQNPNLPVDSVSWDQAMEFCQKLSKQTRRKYRLPTEAEWEYACRAGTTSFYSFGDSLAKTQANYRSTSKIDVGSFPPNDFGLYDMHGNVWEWCLDNYHDNYQDAPTDGSAWTTGGDSSVRILRGGSWNDIPRNCRSAYRDGYEPVVQYNCIGFRVVCEIRTN
jgi:formylglycine-generating enzyme required for sulfatase activity